MTGTDHSQLAPTSGGPVVILVNPQMGENIGAAARAMLNCGLSELRIINPRDGWPNERADANSSGALAMMPPVKVFTSTAEAVADLHHVYATTARPRDMVKKVATARGAGLDMRVREAAGQRIGLLFGAERSGLVNDDVAFAGTVITIPLNPGFSSLNLAQAVLLVAYEWMVAGDNTPARQLVDNYSFPATQASMTELNARLEKELQESGFFRAPDMKPTVLRNLHAMFTRAEMTDQEVKTFHGIISALIGKRLK
ncbi:MAG: spoU rRNA Methylase family protein [Micavibrio sp.]|nr:spoU rRNA Methylase family protein [Micavibrio sp.]